MLGAFAGALFFMSAVQAAAPSAAARWSLQVDPARCLLERRETDHGSAFAIDTIPGSDSYGVAIVGVDIISSDAPVPATLILAPSQKTANGPARIAKLPDGTPIMLMRGLGPAVLDDVAGAESATITAGSRSSRTVRLPSAAKAIAAFRKCSEDQLVEWGADAAQFAPGGRAPIATKDRDEWIADKDLITLFRLSRKPAIHAVFRVSISPTGAIDACSAARGEIEQGVEKGACAAVMNKTFFAPARDAAGRPVRGAATFPLELVGRTS